MIRIFTILAALVAVSQSVEFAQNARLGRTCPPQDSSWTTFLRDYRSCRGYYECSNGRAIHHWCPSGLHFNPMLIACDYPSRAGCYREDVPEVSDVVPQDELPSEGFPEISEPASEEELDLNGPHLGRWCPRVDGRWPTYMVDRLNCNRFYICSNGRAVRQRCPFGLYFNPRALVCDRKENVNCRTWLP